MFDRLLHWLWARHNTARRCAVCHAQWSARWRGAWAEPRDVAESYGQQFAAGYFRANPAEQPVDGLRQRAQGRWGGVSQKDFD